MREFKHPDIMGSKAEVDRRRKYTEEYIKAVKVAVRKVFEGTEEGRLVFKYLMEYCDVFNLTMTGNSWTFFNEGKRDVGLHLLHLRELNWEDEVKQRRNEYLNKIDKGA